MSYFIPGWVSPRDDLHLIREDESVENYAEHHRQRLTLLAKHQCSPLIEKSIVLYCKMSTNLMENRFLTMSFCCQSQRHGHKAITHCSALLSGFRRYLGWPVWWSDTERKALLDFLAVNLLRIMPNITDNASVWVRQLVKGWESVLMISGLPLIHKLNMEIKWK